MKRSKKIAVTGGIGSGKSTVCALLEKRGFPVYSCDAISHELWNDAEYTAGLARLFPDCVSGGSPQKSRLSAIVFSDRRELEKLEDYAHPHIMERLLKRMEADEIAFAEVPLLFERGYEKLFDAVLAVRRKDEARVAAVARRDGLSEREIRGRMARQFPGADLEKKGCFILENDSSLEQLEGELSSILYKILK